jgi:hypothetical protein
VKYLSHVGSVGAMCNCLKIKIHDRVSLFTVFEDMVGGEDESCYQTVVFGISFCSGCLCLLYLEHLAQIRAEDSCCQKDPCCSKCLDEHCYVKSDRIITGDHSSLTARVTASDVAPLLVNRL